MKRIQTQDTRIHNVQACVLGCQDPRLQKGRSSFLEQEYGLKDGDYDPLSAPGSAKWILDGNGEVLLFGVEVAVGLHAGETVYLFHHTDCGAYGGSNNFDGKDSEIVFQKDQLDKAKNMIHEYLSKRGDATPKIVCILEHIGEEEISYEIV